jgi:ABC-type antimicrobial peptide transport system permease subunit
VLLALSAMILLGTLMNKFVSALVGLVLGYGVGAFIGAVLISLISGNTHDKNMEVVMTAAFVTGPLGAIIGLIVGLFRTRRAA